MADKDGMERKVYLLPAELVERIKAYQTQQSIASEVEAARRLLDAALQMRDTVESILDKLRSRFNEEKDLRVLARDVLVGHSLVTKITLEEGAVLFDLKSGRCGSINAKGDMFTGETPDGTVFPYPVKQISRVLKKAPEVPSWDTGRSGAGGGDLDDEIPF